MTEEKKPKEQQTKGEDVREQKVLLRVKTKT